MTDQFPVKKGRMVRSEGRASSPREDLSSSGLSGNWWLEKKGLSLVNKIREFSRSPRVLCPTATLLNGT